MLVVPLILLVSAFFGFLINIFVLSDIYTFRSYSNTSWMEFSIEALSDYVNDWLILFGYDESGALFSESGFHNLFALCLAAVLLVIYIFIIKRVDVQLSQKLFIIWFGCANLCLLFVYLFLDMNLNARYAIPIAIFLIPLVALLFSSYRFEKPIFRKTLTIVFSFLLIAISLFTYKNIWTTTKTPDIKDVVDWAVSNGYTEGFASYWNANILTELSNGELEMICWAPSGAVEGGSMADLDQRYKHNALKSHDGAYQSSNPFMLFKKDELHNREEGGLGPFLFENGKIAYENDIYAIYDLNDNQSLINEYLSAMQNDST